MLSISDNIENQNQHSRGIHPYTSSSRRRGANNREWGNYCEEMTADYLRRKGYTVRERNFRIGSRLEVDIIAQQGDLFVFVEVKARSYDNEDPVDAVDNSKRKRIITVANIYLSQLPHYATYRFDISCITGNWDDHKLEYIEDAFMPDVKNR